MNRKTSITSAALSTCCTAFLHVNANLVKAMLNDMPFDRREAIDQLLKGGSVGIEALVDQEANSTISSLRKPDAEGEEMRMVYATIFVSMPPDEQSTKELH